MMLKTARLNSGNLEFTPRKPFDLLQDVKDVPLSGGGGIWTPVPRRPEWQPLHA